MRALLNRRVTNPDYPASNAEVRGVIARLKTEARQPMRPVVILSGYHSPRAQAEHLRRLLLRLTSRDAAITTAAYTTLTDMPRICGAALAQVRQHAGDRPVDLIGISMGGLISRVVSTGVEIESEAGTIAARTPVNTQRVFTLASPHGGALLAERIAPNAAARDMKRGSVFLRSLDGSLAAGDRPGYELVCYSRLHDGWVGALRAAPPRHGVIWTPGTLWGSHFTVSWDPRILADLALRLRGETPLARASAPPCD